MINESGSWKLYVLQAIAWVFIFIIPYFFQAHELKQIINPQGSIHLISYILLIIFSYVNYLYLVSRLYLKRSFITYFIIVGICFFIVINFPSLFRTGDHFHGMHPPGDSGFNPSHPDEQSPFVFGKDYNILLFVVSVFYSIAIHTKNRLHLIEREKLNAELSFLKAQINPHFLFNTLNSIYALAIIKDENTPNAIVQLSELMRYIIKDADSDKVSLKKEVEYISNYMALQQSRLGDTVAVDYTLKGDMENKRIAPLILITYIENAFKHGANPDRNSIIKVVISSSGNDVSLHVFNNKVNSNNNEKGIGVKNAVERLKALYPDKHKLEIVDNETTYIVNLKIFLND